MTLSLDELDELSLAHLKRASRKLDGIDVVRLGDNRDAVDSHAAAVDEMARLAS